MHPYGLRIWKEETAFVSREFLVKMSQPNCVEEDVYVLLGLSMEFLLLAHALVSRDVEKQHMAKEKSTVAQLYIMLAGEGYCHNQFTTTASQPLDQSLLSCH